MDDHKMKRANFLLIASSIALLLSGCETTPHRNTNYNDQYTNYRQTVMLKKIRKECRMIYDNVKNDFEKDKEIAECINNRQSKI